MIRKSYLAVLLFGLFTAGQAHAQSPMGAMPQFLPTSGWQVQETVLSEVRGLKGVDLPCMMATTYDNGYTLRFSGSDQKILAMAIDFRQDVFTQGRKYTAQLNVHDQYNRDIKGTAFSESVLIFNMRDHGGFHAALAGAPKMTLSVEDNAMVFALSGIDSALGKLERCSTGGDFSSNVQQASLPSKSVSITRAPESQAKHQGKPQGEPMTWDKKVTPVPARISKDIKKAEMAKAPLWEAKAGDDMKATLEGWAARSGVKLDWQATGAAKVADDVRVQGSFEDAVQTLMARNAAALGLDANMKASAKGGMKHRVSSRVSMPIDDVKAPQQLVPNRMGAVSKPSSTASAGLAGSRWSAPMGSSLQHVLQTWSKEAGVELVWQSNQGFAVKRAVASGGSYEAALQSLLNQYTDEKIRPNVQLNNDPVTGRRTLFVQSSRVL